MSPGRNIPNAPNRSSRLVFHAYLRDAQVSMMQLNNPFMSYAELTLPLPCPKQLWFARTAEEFKMRYLESAAADGVKRPPSLGDLFRDVNALTANRHRLDTRFAISIYLHAFWSLIWEHRQLASVHSRTAESSDMNQLLDTRRRDLQTRLQTFHHLITNNHHHKPQPTQPMLSAQESLLLHLLQINLHASLPDLQLFSGREGEEQARSVYPSLQRWAVSSDARRAVWHAAQVLRHGRLFPRGHLKDFWGVAICHAALVLWSWGVVLGNPAADGGRGMGRQQQGGQRGGVVVYLDGEEEMGGEVQAWLGYGQGQPAIRCSAGLGLDGIGTGTATGTGHVGADGGARAAEWCLLEDPRACVRAAQEILRANFVGVWESLPPLSENIIAVLKQLEKAACAVWTG